MDIMSNWRTTAVRTAAMLALLLVISACSTGDQFDYVSSIVDEEGKPIEDVVIIGSWSAVIVTNPVQSQSGCTAAKLVRTDKEGKFALRYPHRFAMLQDVTMSSPTIYKKGYKLKSPDGEPLVMKRDDGSFDGIVYEPNRGIAPDYGTGCKSDEALKAAGLCALHREIGEQRIPRAKTAEQKQIAAGSFFRMERCETGALVSMERQIEIETDLKRKYTP
jgi:hypothetical protein